MKQLEVQVGGTKNEMTFASAHAHTHLRITNALRRRTELC